MPNTNCLEGFRCPACKSYGGFWIRVTMNPLVLMTDDGDLDERETDTDYNAASYCRCDACRHEGVVADFNSKAEAEPDKVLEALAGLLAVVDANTKPDYEGYSIVEKSLIHIAKKIVADSGID